MKIISLLALCVLVAIIALVVIEKNRPGVIRSTEGLFFEKNPSSLLRGIRGHSRDKKSKRHIVKQNDDFKITPKKLFEFTSGVLDEPAEQAMTLIVNTPVAQRTAEDYFIYGRIHETNVAEGQPNNDATAIAAHAYEMAIGHALTEDLLVEQRFMLEHIAAFARDNDIIDMEEAAINATEKTREENIKAAVVTSENKKEIAEAFVESAVKWTSDPQNVHDRGVHADNRKTLDIISKTSEISVAMALSEAKDFINNNDYTVVTKQNALRVLDQVSTGGIITAYNNTEDRIFRDVWARSHLPENSHNAHNIRNAVVLALSQSVSGGSVVCINGRVSNVIGALATLDRNDVVGAAQTIEQRRNEVLRDASRILDKELEDHKAKGDQGNIAKSFIDPNVVPDPVENQSFRDKVSQAIRERVQKEASAFTPMLLEELRIDAEYAAGLLV